MQQLLHRVSRMGEQLQDSRNALQQEQVLGVVLETLELLEQISREHPHLRENLVKILRKHRLLPGKYLLKVPAEDLQRSLVQFIAALWAMSFEPQT